MPSPDTQLVSLAVNLRRAIHQNPELGYEEHQTTALVAEALNHPAIRVTRMSGTGLIAEVGHGDKTVAFRADLDALPITELTDLDFASQTKGIMHACGHDAHTAIAVGLAQHLADHPLDGVVRFIFQPAEEQFPGGAVKLVEDGCLDGVSAIIAFHVDPALEVGKIGLKTGPITSSSDRFEIRLTGPGGHTARPHETVDLMHAAGQMLTSLPFAVYRKIDSRIPAAVVFAQVSAGKADNVIPTEVAMSGTARVLDQAMWDEIPKLIETTAQEIAAVSGAGITFTYTRGIAPVVNDLHVVAAATEALSDDLSHDAVVETYASMGAEDFSSYLLQVPGALLRLGAWDGASEKSALHSAFFDLDESAIGVGIEAGASVLRRLIAEA